MGSSQTRARTHVPCIGRQILNHCATREAQFTDIFYLIRPFIHETFIDCSHVILCLISSFLSYNSSGLHPFSWDAPSGYSFLVNLSAFRVSLSLSTHFLDSIAIMVILPTFPGGRCYVFFHCFYIFNAQPLNVQNLRMLSTFLECLS